MKAFLWHHLLHGLLKSSEVYIARQMAPKFPRCFTFVIFEEVTTSLDYKAVFQLSLSDSFNTLILRILNDPFTFFLIEIALMHLQCLKLRIECHYFRETNDVLFIL